MPFEIDFLPVGDGEKCGDAIAVRYGQPGAYRIMLVDGGTQASGEALVEHVRTYYHTGYVDDVVNSHPDLDHSSGLSVVMEDLKVGRLWMHRPWQHSNLILDYFKDGRITDQSLKERLQGKMSAAYNLEKIATRKGIPIIEPFQGMQIGSFFVLSPEREWYIHDLIAEFEKSPARKSVEAALVAADSARFVMFKAFTESVKAAITKWAVERWDLELLRENVETSAENESSTILYAWMPDYNEGLLLTGDAGVRATGKALNYLEAHNINPAAIIKFMQIPHHGGRHNVSPSILNRLVGPRLATRPTQFTKAAYASASASSDYPRHMVKNAFLRRGSNVASTKGISIRYQRGMPSRGWSPLTRAEFSTQVEAWD